MNKDEIKKVLQRCSAVDSKTSRSDCPDCYRRNDLLREACCIITEQEKEIEQLTEYLAKEQEACVECELEQSWKLYARDKEIDRVKEFAEKLKARITKFMWRHNIPECIFNDIMSDLLKEYEK